MGRKNRKTKKRLGSRLKLNVSEVAQISQNCVVVECHLVRNVRKGENN